MSRRGAIRHFPDPLSMNRRAAGYVAEVLSSAVTQQGYASLVLSGGSTPLRLYELLTGQPYAATIPWARVCFFWGDERFVPADHQDSNYRLAWGALLSRVPAVGENIYPVPVGLGWHESARAYEAVLKKFFRERAGSSEGPQARFDLVLLGLGKDGHTASVFPCSPDCCGQGWVSAVQSPEGVQPRRRITMTTARLSKSERVLFLATGEKKDIVDRVFGSGEAAGDYPAGNIRAQKQISVFLSDQGM